MTREDHDKYIEEIKRLQSEVSEMDFSDLELTQEESDALAEMDPKYLELLAASLSRYTPAFPEYDYRQAIAEKTIARFMLSVLPVAEKAYRMGVKTT